MISFKGMPCVYAEGPGCCQEGYCAGCEIHQKYRRRCVNNCLVICPHNDLMMCSRCQVGLEWAGKMAKMQDAWVLKREGPFTPLSEAEDIE
ncbi:hypothetical protein LCGC14_1517370 [marine sediment metagenome]|uniref:Uncharacterized protein n=1 Tax=marine sediment metagenome TaxID=412755 RepID=A0A0F9M0T4_9ZZZZ